jgi:hypothetical protein
VEVTVVEVIDTTQGLVLWSAQVTPRTLDPAGSDPVTLTGHAGALDVTETTPGIVLV